MNRESATTPRHATVGSGSFAYEADAAWAKLPPGPTWSEVSGVAVDSQDRVFVFSRCPHRVLIFDRDGNFLSTWGEGRFVRAHGITIGPDDSVYCADDLDHTVQKFTADGQLLFSLGTSGQPSDTGSTSIDYRTIKHAGLPFNYPTNLALSAAGDLYLADGYGNARSHKFSAEGKLLFSWGEPGSGPGQFHLPHGIAIDQHGVIYVADRENSRVQRFTPEGAFLSEITDVLRPCQVAFDTAGNVYVAELGYRSGMWPGTTAPTPNASGGRVSIFDATGKLLCRWGGGENPTAPGDFFAPHDIRVDSRGDLYVAEVVMSAGGNRGLVSPDCHSLQKFRLIKS